MESGYVHLKLPSKEDFVESVVALYSYPIQFSARCTVNYRKFPFDVIVCTVAFLIPGGTLIGNNISQYNQVHLRWLESESPIKVMTQIDSNLGSIISYDPGFKIAQIETSCDDSGILCQCKFHMERYFMFYVLQAYVTSFMLVLLGYFSFFIPFSSPNRSSLSSASLIAEVLMYQNINNSVPTVGYVRGIDVWYIGCLICIFIPLMIYALSVFEFGKQGQVGFKNKFAEKVDKVSVWLFPVGFGVFCAAYFGWTTN